MVMVIDESYLAARWKICPELARGLALDLAPVLDGASISCYLVVPKRKKWKWKEKDLYVQQISTEYAKIPRIWRISCT
jgi:hypothetical protein